MGVCFISQDLIQTLILWFPDFHQHVMVVLTFLNFPIGQFDALQCAISLYLYVVPANCLR